MGRVGKRYGKGIEKMREVPKDDMWGDAQERADDKATEVELRTQVDGLSDYADRQEAQNAPTQAELVIISLLMRLYDLQLALLSSVNEKRANEIYATHEKGGTFNPNIFIPEVKNVD